MTAAGLDACIAWLGCLRRGRHVWSWREHADGSRDEVCVFCRAARGSRSLADVVLEEGPRDQVVRKEDVQT